MGTVVILHNIRSVHNVGSVFRTADAAGVEKIILCGYTPTPLDRFGRERNDFVKVSLGAEKTVAWEHRKTLAAAIKKLKQENYFIVAIEQSSNSVSLFDYRLPKNNSASRRIALIFGNEVRGISPASLKHADVILEIPMRGRMVRQAHHPRNSKRGKESLNVSVAAGIALFALLFKKL